MFFQNQLFKISKIRSYFGLLMIADRLHTDTASGSRPNLQYLVQKKKKISMTFNLCVEKESKFHLSKKMSNTIRCHAVKVRLSNQDPLQ